jgi:ferric-dicitrate binding protein FerR (iron transport regulator)
LSAQGAPASTKSIRRQQSQRFHSVLGALANKIYADASAWRKGILSASERRLIKIQKWRE